MIRRAVVPGGEQAEFYLDRESPVSVVGEFNSWNPEQGVMQLFDAALPTTRSWSTKLAPGRHAFRYVDSDGNVFDDPEADAYEPDDYGGFHRVIVVAEALPPASSTPSATREG